MEITYDTGAKVILQGPVTYEVEANGGYLAVGKLTGKLEKNDKRETINAELSDRRSAFSVQRSAFVIRTPTATVTDLGTEFGVETAKDGATEVHVYQGEVISRPCMAGNGEAAAVHVKEGHAVRIGPRSRNPVSIAFAPRSFVHRTSLSKEGPVETAYIDAVLADKPLGYWPLNEPRYSKRCADRSGHGFHGIPDLMGSGVGGDPTGLPTDSGPMPGKSNAIVLSRAGEHRHRPSRPICLHGSLHH